MPESSYKYLYERLGDDNFQLLVNALLTRDLTGFLPLPLGQADGGRDGITRAPDRTVIYQVKWTKDSVRDPVTWLDQAIAKESEKITRLAGEGVKRYVMVTNVPSTGKAKTGTFDKLNDRLDEHAKAYGLEQMDCFWRERVDAMVDDAPDDLLWKYAEMLAGWELIRYLIAEDSAGQQETRLRHLVRSVAAVQWDEDERVKFSQVETVNREKVADLFVDVSANELLPGQFGPDGGPHYQLEVAAGGAADHLLKVVPPEERRWNTLVRGAPGQGKSTLSQYVSQVHRSAFVTNTLRPANLTPPKIPLFPLRVDLSDYARWISGIDIFDPEAEMPKKAKKRPAAEIALEQFFADVMTHAAGASVAAAEVQELFRCIPCLVVLDGLDEVGRPKLRGQVVAEIDNFARRARNYAVRPQIVVTTRPSSNELPEPSIDLFAVLVLNPLTAQQRAEYLRRWTAVHHLTTSEGRKLRAVYREKISEPYLDELAGNPMQLTILLDLLHSHGEATPQQRTALYDSYVEKLLIREANKHPQSVRKHQTELRSIIPFLGWHLHAHSETDPINFQMSTKDLKASIAQYLRTYGKRESVVDELFEAATDRLWALTSKVEGTYEFEVLSMREYFAANFLYRFAGEETKGFNQVEVLRELLRRPYWLNAARFYAGNAEGRDLATVVDGVIDELQDSPPDHAVIASWTLLTDGVFASRPRRAREVLTALCDDPHLHVLINALTRREISPLPTLPQPEGAEPDPTWQRLTERISADPTHSQIRLQVRVLRELLNQAGPFATWWTEQATAHLDDPEQLDAWLQIAATCQAATGQTIDLPGVDLTRPQVAQRILNAGVVPPPGGQLEEGLVGCVLDGLCPSVSSARSLPGQIAIAFSPENYLTKSKTGFPTHSEDQRRLRQQALKGLRGGRKGLAAAVGKRQFGKGQKGSTFPWANTASALLDEVGPCWLVSQIAIMGAASPMQLGVIRQPNKEAFGSNSHPAALLEQTREHARDAAWWRAELERLQASHDLDETQRHLALAEWCLALWCVADGDVIVELFETWVKLYSDLPEPRRRPIVDCAWRCHTAGWISPLPSEPNSTDPALSGLLTQRNPPPATGGRDKQPPSRPPAVNHQPLLEVARSLKWFKVDDQGVYR